MIKQPRSKKGWTEAETRHVWSLYKAGKSRKEISQTVDRTPNAIYLVLHYGQIGLQKTSLEEAQNYFKQTYKGLSTNFVLKTLPTIWQMEKLGETQEVAVSHTNGHATNEQQLEASLEALDYAFDSLRGLMSEVIEKAVKHGIADLQTSLAKEFEERVLTAQARSSEEILTLKQELVDTRTELREANEWLAKSTKDRFGSNLRNRLLNRS